MRTTGEREVISATTEQKKEQTGGEKREQVFSPSPLLSLPLLSCSCTVYTVCFLSTLLCPLAANGLSGGALPPPLPARPLKLFLHLERENPICILRRAPPALPQDKQTNENVPSASLLCVHFGNVQKVIRSHVTQPATCMSVKALSHLIVDGSTRCNWT